MAVDHERLRTLFIAACDLTSEDRAAFIEENCSDDPELRTQLELLLLQDGSNGILSDDDMVAGVRLPLEFSDRDTEPVMIRGYRIKRLLGRGGMGAVWLAEQSNPKRDVAVKVVRAGLVGRGLMRRFELEASVLARLRHPGIAQIYEAGMFDDGGGAQPFFAMEYIDGAPLGDYVQEHRLAVRERLELFAKICDAVHHAHQKGVIHRDLKPGNILVTADGQPKILDFGVARATDQDIQITTLQTRAGQLIGTVPYMSPEQIDADKHQVDTRTDVYSLGVILFELLAGRLPYDVKDRTIAGAARVITEVDPTPLSTVDRAFRGDLATITQTALEKDPERRYQSAAALADDVRRHLRDQPIAARPATTVYQLSKFARRNKALVTGVAIAFLAVSAGAIGATVGMVRAQRQADRAEAMNDFLESVLVAANTARSGDMRVVDLLHDAADRVDTEFVGHPDLAIRIHTLLSVAFQSVGLSEAQERHARRALALVEEQSGERSRQTRDPRFRIAEALFNQVRLREAERVARPLFEGPEAAIRDRPGLQARRLVGQILAQRRSYDDAEAMLRETLAEAEGVLGRHDYATIQILYTLANTLELHAMFGDHGRDRAGLRDEAARLYRAVIEDERESNAPTFVGLKARHHLAEHFTQDGRYDEAIEMSGDAMKLAETWLGPDHTQLADVLVVHARALYNAGRAVPAAAHFNRAVAIHLNQDNDVGSAVAMADAMPVLDAAEQWAKAMQYAQVLAERFGEDTAHTDFAMSCRIWVPYLHARLGEQDQAAPLFDALLAEEDAMTDLNRAGLHYARGVWCEEQGQPSEALEHYSTALAHCGDLSHHWPRRQAVIDAIEALETSR